MDGEDTVQMSRREMVRSWNSISEPGKPLVMNNVEQEIVFGLENLGLPNNLMKRRLMEMSTSLGLSGDLSQEYPSCQGAETESSLGRGNGHATKEILLLDEPTSQLDPVAAEEILNIIRRLNEDNGITVVMIEQRLERCCHLADRILLMENGLIAADINTGGREGCGCSRRLWHIYLPYPIYLPGWI